MKTISIVLTLTALALAGCPSKPAKRPQPPPPRPPTVRPEAGLLPRAQPPDMASLANLTPSNLAIQYPAGLTDHDKKFVSVHCAFGLPKKDPAFNHGETVHVVHNGYVLLHSSKRKLPLWACEAVTKAQLRGTVARSGIRIKEDTALLEYPRARLADYKRSGYHRGRMASCGNQMVDPRLKAERLMLSNVAPMKPEFRKGIWHALEAKVRSWIKTRGYARIITGPILLKPEGGADTDYLFIGQGRVIVPTHYFKIVLAPGADGRWQAIAFVLKNRQYETPYNLKVHIKSIDWIEKNTGFDFLPDLTPAQQKRVESRPAKMW